MLILHVNFLQIAETFRTATFPSYKKDLWTGKYESNKNYLIYDVYFQNMQVTRIQHV